MVRVDISISHLMLMAKRGSPVLVVARPFGELSSPTVPHIFVHDAKGIEKKYGKPIEHWMKELKKVSKLAHMEQVAHLKTKFEMGHGHANALVAVFRKENGL